jgi:outer membrane protein OmpA-like peptidoglycan-associated protein
MTSSVPEPDGRAGDGGPGSGTEDLEVLRELILGPLRDRLQELEDRLDDPRRRAIEVGEILPDAVRLRTRRDRRLAGALMGTVEEIVRSSVRKDRHTLARALSPIVSLAVRKSVAEFFQRILQAVNRALEVSWSWRGLKWRLEAYRTGRSFAEIVLLKTLEYRVEQVFLIHAETGLLMAEAEHEALAKDPALVSAMLRAIQDFAADSFEPESEDRLDVITFGDLSIWLENGPEAILACVIRGSAPQELRDLFRTTLEQIHEEGREQLASFAGDPSDLEAIHPHLAACLVSRRREPEGGVSKPLWVALALVVLVVAVGVALFVRDGLRWRSYVERLRSEPGIVVVAEDHGWRGSSIAGLRDPLASDPEDLMRESALDGTAVAARWEPYLALDPQIVERRARRLLSPPPTVELQRRGSVLKVSGEASHAWVSRLDEVAALFPSVQVESEDLVDLDRAAVDRIGKGLEELVLRFEVGRADLLAGHERDLDRAVHQVIAWLRQVEAVEEGRPRLAVVGHTDATGTESDNIRLSRQRAERVRDRLIESGIEPSLVEALGVGTTQPVPYTGSSEDERRSRNRSVTLRPQVGDGG